MKQIAPKVVVCVGPPKAGVTTACEIVRDASESAVSVISFPCPLRDIEQALARSELVLVDVDAGGLSALAVQAFVDCGLLNAASGAVIVFHVADDSICLYRAEDGELTPEDLKAWHDNFISVEEKIRRHGVALFGISAPLLSDTILQLAWRCELKR